MATFGAWRALIPSHLHPIAFEHANALEGCGVTHAHVHLVTIPRSVRSAELFDEIDLEGVGGLSALVGETRELFWSVDSAGSVSAKIDQSFLSQFARRAVAAANEVSFESDWKSYTHAEWYEASRKVTGRLATLVLERSPQLFLASGSQTFASTTLG
jgi:hypothetical protein